MAHPSQSFLSHRHILYCSFSCGISFSILSLSQTHIIFALSPVAHPSQSFLSHRHILYLLFLLWHILLNPFSLTDTYYICSYSCGISFSILSLSQTHIIFALSPVAHPSQSFLTHRHTLYLSFSCGTSFSILSFSQTHNIFPLLLWHILLNPFFLTDTYYICSFSCGTSFSILSFSQTHIIFALSPVAHPFQSFLSHRHILYLLFLLWHILLNPFFLTDTYYICSFSCGTSFSILSFSQTHIIFALSPVAFPSQSFLSHRNILYLP